MNELAQQEIIMSQSGDFFKKYGWISFVLLTLGYFVGGAIGMKKTGLIIGGSAIDSLVVIILIPAVRYGELNIRGNIFYRNETPIAFYIVAGIFASLGIAVAAIFTWIVLTWNV